MHLWPPSSKTQAASPNLADTYPRGVRGPTPDICLAPPGLLLGTKKLKIRFDFFKVEKKFFFHKFFSQPCRPADPNYIWGYITLYPRYLQGGVRGPAGYTWDLGGEKKFFFFKNRKKIFFEFSKNRPGRKQDPRALGPGGYDRGPTPPTLVLW